MQKLIILTKIYNWLKRANKMPIYSYSKISTFEQCPLKFKYRYIEKIIPKIDKTIDSHLGKCVHSTLEWFYSEIKKNNIPTMDELISFYLQKWEEDYFPEMPIIDEKLTARDYLNKGIGFLVTYYLENKPFDDNTLEVEKEISINLDLDGGYKIKGFIDRLSYNLATNEYEIHDYKTSNSLPRIEKIENDKQLSLYSIAIKELFGYDKEVKLIWHYLAHNKKISRKKTNADLDLLKKEILELTKKIEQTKEFPPNKSILCNWCEYKDICPEWKK